MKPAVLVVLTAWLCQAGALRVLVRDPSGAAIANATVRAGAEVQVTDSTGSTRFEGVNTGRITVSIEAEGFAAYTTRTASRLADDLRAETRACAEVRQSRCRRGPA